MDYKEQDMAMNQKSPYEMPVLTYRSFQLEYLLSLDLSDMYPSFVDTLYEENPLEENSDW